jgi:tRNA (adenine37-N6)-methyltransferase
MSFIKNWLTVILVLFACSMLSVSGNATENRREFYIKPIGEVQRVNNVTQLVLDKKYQDGLYGLDDFSHIWVIWWFDKNDNFRKRSVLQVKPKIKKGQPLTGVFACRAPVRPNLIGITLCKIKSVNNNIITIDKIDAFDKTPIIDIKPYIAKYDSINSAWGPFSKRKRLF